MQDQNKLYQCINFILYNSCDSAYISKRFSIDSRSLEKNKVFISLERNSTRNLKNIKHAIKKGASAFISPFPVHRKDIKSAIPYLISKDIYSLYIELFKIDQNKISFKSIVVGITGTNGKTSTVLALAQALTLQNKKVGVISSAGIGIYPTMKKTEYTTPPVDINYDHLLKFRKRKCDYIIIECSSQGLEQGRLRGFIFDYSFITNIDKDHIDYHKTLKNYINSKLQIINSSKNTILNYDSSHLKNIDSAKYRCKKLIYISDKKNRFKKVFNTSIRINQNQLIFFNKYTIISIIAFMKLEKFKNIEIIESLDNLTPIEGRRQIINTKNKGTFIIDYAHTSEAFKNIFGDFPTKKKVYTLFGCGGERDKSKRSEIGNIVDSYSTGIVITEDNSRMENFKVITRDIIKGIKNTNKLFIIESRKAAIKYLFKHSYPNHLNFILGKGNEDYIMKKNMKKKHNDITFLRNIIKNYET